MRLLQRAEVGRKGWDAFCDAHPGAYWWWRSEWLDYQVARGGKQDLSFGIVDGEFLVAIYPVFLEGDSFTMEGHPGPGGLSQGRPETWPGIVIKAREHITGVARDHKASVLRCRWSPFAYGIPTAIPDDFSDISWHTQLLDLTQSEAALHAGVRKSYTALINQAKRNYEVEVDDSGRLIGQMMGVHAEASGRMTRPKETWDMMGQWCKSGNGLIVGAWSCGYSWLAFAYFVIYKKAAYYASGPSLRTNVQHALVWRAMLELKARGVETLEMGWIDYPGDPPGLGLFKTGFGGKAAPVVAVERRFDRCAGSMG